MRPKWRTILREGIIAGVIGFGATIVLFAIANVLSGRPVFHTAALPGDSLFYGIRDTMQVVVTPRQSGQVSPGRSPVAPNDHHQPGRIHRRLTSAGWRGWLTGSVARGGR